MFNLGLASSQVPVPEPSTILLLRVRAEISSQIFRVEASGWQGAKGQEYLAYSELSQRGQPGCIGAKNVKLFLREPLVHAFTNIEAMNSIFTNSSIF